MFKKLLIPLLLISYSLFAQIKNIPNNNSIFTIESNNSINSVINLNGTSGSEPSDTWPELMLSSYLDINSHITYTQTEQDSILARLSKPHIVNYFGPDSVNKTICDFFLYFKRVPGLVITRTSTKTGKLLDWDYGYGIYSQVNLPPQNTTGVITVTSEDSFNGCTQFNISNNSFFGPLPNLSYFATDVLTTFYLDFNSFEITWPDVFGGNIRTIYWAANTATTMPAFSNASSIELIRGYNCGITNYQSNIFNPSKLRQIYMYGNNMDADEIMQLFTDLDNMVGTISQNLTVRIEGTNMGCIPDGYSNSTLVSIGAKYTAAGYTFTPTIQTGCAEAEVKQMIFDTIGYDNPTDALALYWDSTGITDTDIQTHLTWWADSIYNRGYWNLFNVIYPYQGSSEEEHSFNLKDVNAYKIDFGGTTTHSSTGVLGSWSGYANTGYQADSLQPYNFSLSTYSRTDFYNGSIDYDAGVKAADGDKLNVSFSSPVSGQQSVYSTALGKTMSHPFNNTQGLITITTDTNNTSVYIDGMKSFADEYVYDSLPDEDIYFMAENNYGSVYNQALREISFSTIGKHFTDEQKYHIDRLTLAYLDSINRKIEIPTRYIGRETSNFPISITTPTKTYSPSTSRIGAITAFDTLKIGALICYNSRSYVPSQFGIEPYSPYVITLDDIDFGPMFERIDSFPIDYVGLTVFEAFGFGLDTIDIPFPKRLIDKFEGFTKYDAESNPMMDQDIISEFVDTCQSHGKKAYLYVNPMRNLNLQPYSAFAHVAWDSMDCVVYDNWLAAYLQDLQTKYDPDGFWIDGWASERISNDGKRTVNDVQYIYNAIKEVDSTDIVIWNHLSDTGFVRFPYDVGSTEELAFSDTDANVADTNRHHLSTRYFQPQEFIMSPSEGAVWYAQDDEGVTVRLLSEVQDFYDRADAVGASFNMAIIPGRNGIVQEDQWEIWRNMSW